MADLAESGAAEAIEQPAGQQPEPGAETPAEGQPAAAVAAEPKLTSVDEPKFPWRDYRKLNGQIDELTSQLEQSRAGSARAEELKAQLEEHKEIVQDYHRIAKLIARRPDLAEQLDLIGREATAGAATQAATALDPKVQAKIDAMEKQLSDLHGAYQTQQQRQQAEAKQAELAETGRELDGKLATLLKERSYAEGLLPYAKGYVLQRIRELKGVSMEEVPYLFGEWHRAMEEQFTSRLNGMKEGAGRSAASPASPVGNGMPLGAKPDLGALDGKTSQALEAGLKRLGWN